VTDNSQDIQRVALHFATGPTDVCLLCCSSELPALSLLLKG